MEAARGHPRGLRGHICSTVTAIPGASCGPSCVAKPQSPGTARVQGGGPGPWFFRLSCCGPAAWGGHGAEPGPQLEGRQRGSRWFGQSAAGAWSRRPVSVFHCSTPLSAARPGVGRGAQGRKQPSRGNPSSSPWGPHGHVSSPPGASVSFSVNHLHSPPYLPSWEQCEVMRVRCFDKA